MDTGSPVIILGVTGSIAAYRSLDLIRRFGERNVLVRVVATENALPFFSVLSAEVFSGNPVSTRLFSGLPVPFPGSIPVRHLNLLEGANALVIAPASADFIARMALGLADDLLSTVALSATIPIFIAPAMEEAMYNHPASTTHRRTLSERGVVEIPPDTGALASGKNGLGRMASVDRILSTVLSGLDVKGSLAGLRILVSAGPTYEPLDAVRFIGNRSSGRMGYALAEAARSRGAEVTLVSGPVSLPPPDGVSLHKVSTATEMASALEKAFPENQVLVMTAAVGDYRPMTAGTGKRKKDGKPWTLKLLENQDILKSLASSKRPDQFIIGFAAESEIEPSTLLGKCRSKKVDLLVANDISNPETGFGSRENAIILVTPSGDFEEIGKKEKISIAHDILDRIPLGSLLDKG